MRKEKKNFFFVAYQFLIFSICLVHPSVLSFLLFQASVQALCPYVPFFHLFFHPSILSPSKKYFQISEFQTWTGPSPQKENYIFISYHEFVG